MNDNKVKIASLEVSNVKRVKAVYISPTQNGLTTIGGNNTQGKSSVIDAIMHNLLGDRYKPTTPIRTGAQKAETTVKLSNGLIVNRRYTKAGGSYLSVTTADGLNAGQQLLNELLAELALNLGQFLSDTPKKKAETLLKALGIDTQPLDERISDLMALRLDKGRERDKAEGYYKSLPFHGDVGEAKSSAEIVERITKAHETNQKKTDLQQAAQANHRELEVEREGVAALEADLQRVKERLGKSRERVAYLEGKEKGLVAEWRAAESVDIEPLKAELAGVEAYNVKARENAAKKQAKTQWDALAGEYTSMTHEIEGVRDERKSLLDANPLPLDGLEIVDGELIYKGQAWDGMSGAERLIVATAVCSTIKPTCGFVMLDGLEQMDLPTLEAYNQYLIDRGLQAIGTRVSTGSECTLIITDGTVADDEIAETKE